MNKWVLAWLLCMAAAAANAKSPDAMVTESIDFEGEFSRIQATRQQQEALYEQEESQCYARFSVTNCVNSVRKRRRDSLEMLHKQEVVFRRAERQHKAAAQLQRVKEKTSEEHLEQNASSRREAIQAQKEREERAGEKASEHAKPASNRVQERAKAQYQGRSAQDIALEKKRYQDKLDQAREQRTDREKRRLENAGKRAMPLPPAP